MELSLLVDCTSNVGCGEAHDSRPCSSKQQEESLLLRQVDEEQLSAATLLQNLNKNPLRAIYEIRSRLETMKSEVGGLMDCDAFILVPVGANKSAKTDLASSKLADTQNFAENNNNNKPLVQVKAVPITNNENTLKMKEVSQDGIEVSTPPTKGGSSSVFLTFQHPTPLSQTTKKPSIATNNGGRPSGSLLKGVTTTPTTATTTSRRRKQPEDSPVNSLSSSEADLPPSPKPHRRRGDTSTSNGKRRKFACGFPGCGKTFGQTNHLQAHRRLHTGERPFVCSFEGCNKAFTQTGHLTAHLRIHTGERPYACSFPGCQKRFTQSTNMRMHMKVHGGMDGSSPTQSSPNNSGGTVACRFAGCSRMFGSRRGMETHMRSVHLAMMAAAGASPDESADQDSRHHEDDDDFQLHQGRHFQQTSLPPRKARYNPRQRFVEDDSEEDDFYEDDSCASSE